MATPIPTRSLFERVTRYSASHKLVVSAALLVVLGAGYLTYSRLFSSSGVTTYVLAQAAPRTIVSSISASGQVAASDQIDVKPRVSARVTRVLVQTGSVVAAGQPIAYLDSTDAQTKVTQAEAALVTSKLQFQKDSAQAPIDYEKARDQLAQDTADLADAYTDTFNTLASTYLDLSPIMTNIQDALFGYTLSATRSQWNVDVMVNYFPNESDRAQAQKFAESAKSDYQTARTKFDAALTKYKLASRDSSPADLETLLNLSADMSIAVAQAVQSELNFLNTVSDLAQKANIQTSSAFATLQSTARTNITTANARQSALVAQKKSLTTLKLAIKSDQQNIDLLQVGNSAGSNPISLQVSAASIAADEAALAQLKADLADYVVRSPFYGTVASVSAKVGDTPSTIASIITKTQVAELSVNEVDAAKISVGQKATLTLDAIEDVTLAGTVASVDPVGTVSQGVVSYTVKVGFATQDSRVKPGMTVNASIITATRTNVLAVPSSAVKNSPRGGQHVLRTNDAPASTTPTTAVELPVPPTQVSVETGITDDVYIEIISGISEGDFVVTRTTNGGTAGAPTGTILSALGARAPGSTNTRTTGGTTSARPGN